MTKVDSPIKYRKRTQLSKSKEEYAALDKGGLEEKYISICKYLLRKEWKFVGSDKTVDGTPFNGDDYDFATAKLELVELEFVKRYPNTFEHQMVWLLEKVNKSLDPLEKLN